MQIGCPNEVSDWIRNGVDINPMFKYFKGNFIGRSYDSESPPMVYFQNSPICKGFEKFI